MGKRLCRGGLARLPQAYPNNMTVGEEMINIGTGSGNALDNQLAELTESQKEWINKEKSNLERGFKEPSHVYETINNPSLGIFEKNTLNPFKGPQEPTTKEEFNNYLKSIGVNKKVSSLNDPYADIKGHTAELPLGASNSMSDATWSGLDNKFSDLGTTISDAFIPSAGSVDDATGLASLDITGKPNYGFEEMDKWGIDRMNLEKEDEVVSRSFKDHDNLKSWLNANPNMGENIKRKAIDFYEGAKDVGRWGIDKTTAFKDMLLSGAGQVIDFPLAAFGKVANVVNPLSVGSSNYNPSLRPQIDMLNKMGMLSGSSGSSGPYKITSGALRGKNLVSGFGTNDYNKMLQKRIDYFNKFKEKRGLTIAQNKKLQDAIAEKKAADAAAAARAAASKKQWQQDYSNWRSPSGRDHSTTGGIGSAQSKQGPAGGSVGASRFQ